MRVFLATAANDQPQSVLEETQTPVVRCCPAGVWPAGYRKHASTIGDAGAVADPHLMSGHSPINCPRPLRLAKLIAGSEFRRRANTDVFATGPRVPCWRQPDTDVLWVS